MERLEERLDILCFEARECDANIGRARGDEPDAVMIKQVDAKLLCIDALDLDQHEVATVEGIDAPALRIFRLIRDLEDPFRTNSKRFAFLLPLCRQPRGLGGVP